MPMPNYPKEPEIFDRFLGSLSTHLTRMDESPQNTQNSHVEKMRCVDVIVVPVHTPLDPGSKVRLEQELGDGGGVDHDHTDSRSFRMTFAADVLSFTPERAWSRASISSRVASAAIRSISPGK